MSAPQRLGAFSALGIELEYMIVDAGDLSVRPLAGDVLRRASGGEADDVDDVARGAMGWSNELAMHVIEIKNRDPEADAGRLAPVFQAEVQSLNGVLREWGARLMPGGMHPWMDPRRETRLWRHDPQGIYRSFDRLFDCRRHGWANLQSMHLNLPFADDAEFARLHAAVRLVLPLLPALAASSPIADGRDTGLLDYRLEVYRHNSARLPSITGEVIPEGASSRRDYEQRILDPIYADIAPLDRRGVLRHEWINARGAIARFERNAIEIRVIDVQECPAADVAVAAATVHAVRGLYDGVHVGLDEQRGIATARLAPLLLACMRAGERALIEDAGYLRLLGFPGQRCEARELWRWLLQGIADSDERAQWREPLATMLEHGPLARRILRAVGGDVSPRRLQAVYGELCECLAQGRMFVP